MQATSSYAQLSEIAWSLASERYRNRDVLEPDELSDNSSQHELSRLADDAESPTNSAKDAPTRAGEMARMRHSHAGLKELWSASAPDHPSPLGAESSAARFAAGNESRDVAASSFDSTLSSSLGALWRGHCNAMDAMGGSANAQLQHLHTSTMQELAAIRQFDLKAATQLLSAYTSACGEVVLQQLRGAAGQDAGFVEAVLGSVKERFSATLASAVVARDEWHRSKAGAAAQRHSRSLTTARGSAALEMESALKQQRERLEAEKAAELQAVHISMGEQAERNAKEVAALHIKLEVLNSQHDQLREQAASSKRETEWWRTKCERAVSKMEALKKERKTLIQQAEDHITQLNNAQQQEIQQRDYVLRRCKDTILALEAQLKDLHGGGSGTGATKHNMDSTASFSRTKSMRFVHGLHSPSPTTTPPAAATVAQAPPGLLPRVGSFAAPSQSMRQRASSAASTDQQLSPRLLKAPDGHTGAAPARHPSRPHSEHGLRDMAAAVPA